MLTEIRLHGDLGEKVGKLWKAQISSVGEGIRAVEINSKRKLFKYLISKDKEGIKYQVLINGRDFEKGEFKEDKPETILSSELSAINKNIKTIDVVPVIEGSSDVLNTILGALLVAVGVVLLIIPGFNVLGGALTFIGLGLLAAGVAGLISKPPDFEAFQERGKSSYLFNGPENTVGEGGPVPIIYGRLIVGSVTVAASYKTLYFNEQGLVEGTTSYEEVIPEIFTPTDPWHEFRENPTSTVIGGEQHSWAVTNVGGVTTIRNPGLWKPIAN